MFGFFRQYHGDYQILKLWSQNHCLLTLNFNSLFFARVKKFADYDFVKKFDNLTSSTIISYENNNFNYTYCALLPTYTVYTV